MNISLVEPIAQYVIGVLVIVGLGWIVDHWRSALSKSRVEPEPRDSIGHLASQRIWMLVIGVLAGFTSAFILKFRFPIDTGSAPLFWVILLLAMLSGGIFVYFVGPWLERQNLSLWIRFLLAFMVGFIGSMIGCLFIPIAIYVIVTSSRIIDDLKGEDWN